MGDRNCHDIGVSELCRSISTVPLRSSDDAIDAQAGGGVANGITPIEPIRARVDAEFEDVCKHKAVVEAEINGAAQCTGELAEDSPEIGSEKGQAGTPRLRIDLEADEALIFIRLWIT